MKTTIPTKQQFQDMIDHIKKILNEISVICKKHLGVWSEDQGVFASCQLMTGEILLSLPHPLVL